MTIFHAHPYTTEHQGFSFDSLDGFKLGMETMNKQGIEEVEIQFIEGADHLAKLIWSLNISQASIEFWFENLEELDEMDAERFRFLAGCGYCLEDVLERYEDVCLFEGDPSDYAAEFIDDIFNVPDGLQYYIDFEAIGFDMEMNGDITQVAYKLLVVTPDEF